MSARDQLNDLVARARARVEERAREQFEGGLFSDAAFSPNKTSRTLVLDDDKAPARTTPIEKTLQELGLAQSDLAAKVAELEERVDNAVVGMLDNLDGLRKKLKLTDRLGQETRALQTKASVGMASQQKATQAALRGQAQAAQLQSIHGAIGAMQVAAYGEPGQVFSTNNLLLAGNQAFWGMAESLAKSLGFAESGPAPGLLAWLAPLGSLATGHLVLGRKQHVRFVSGVASFSASSSRFELSLVDRIAPASRDAFARSTDMPVAVTPLDGFNGGVSLAIVRNGILIITVTRSTTTGAGPGRLAWMVDVGALNG